MPFARGDTTAADDVMLDDISQGICRKETEDQLRVQGGDQSVSMQIGQNRTKIVACLFWGCFQQKEGSQWRNRGCDSLPREILDRRRRNNIRWVGDECEAVSLRLRWGLTLQIIAANSSSDSRSRGETETVQLLVPRCPFDERR